MPISGLVITFDAPVEQQAAALKSLRELPEIEIGHAGGSKLAVVVASTDKRRDQEIWHMVRDLPGVIDLAVAMIAFDEEIKNMENESIRNPG